MAGLRLDKIIADFGFTTRKEAKTLISSGKVAVNGSVCKDPAAKADQQTALVLLEGVPLCIKPNLYLMLNKPAGVICANKDELHQTVLELLPPQLRRKGLFPAGRLDKDTEGFVFITDDGVLAHKVLAPKNKLPKTYHAVVDGQIEGEIITRFASGAVLRDGTVCQPACLRVLQDGAQPLCEVIITQGMYHQVKRMFEAFGKKVLWLKRVKIGALELDENLLPGESREILPEEMNKILTNEAFLVQKSEK